MDKTIDSTVEAIRGIASGSSISVGGFGLCGIPSVLIDGLLDSGVTDLEVVSNNCGVDDWGLGLPLAERRIKRMTASYVGENKEFERQYLHGELEVELVPQGTLAEKLRAGGAGIPALFTPTGAGSQVALGGLPRLFDRDGRIVRTSSPKETREFTLRERRRGVVLEEAITCDFGLVRAAKGDRYGNLVFHSTARNFNPLAAMAATVTIAEVEELVEPGEIDPDDVHLPGIYVRRVLPLTADQARDKRIERIVVRPRESATVSDPGHDSGSRPRRVPARIGWTRDEMAARAAEELADGDYVNLGIGLPTLVPSFVPDDLELVLHSGNGVLGVGPYPYDGDADADADTVDAGKAAVTLRRGASVFDSSASFAMIRGGRIDAAVLGAMQVSERGDIANWMIPGSIIKGMGGAMDLAAGAKRVIVLMDHLAKDGSTKVMRECSLPITGLNVADRIITNLCVFDVTPGGLILRDLAPGVTEEQVRRHTEPAFTVGDVLSSQR